MIGSRELKTRLGTYLRRVREGETLVISDRGRPVAELRPMVKPASSLEARLQQLAAQGVITLGSGRPLRPFKPLRIKGPPLSQTVMEDREDRF